MLAPAPGLAQVSERSWIMSPVVPLDNDVLAQICIPSLCTAEESYREGGNDVPDSRHANLQTSLPVVKSYTVGVSRRHENIARIPLPFLLCAHRISHATSPVQVCLPSLDSADTLMVTHSSSSSSTDMLKALLDRSDDGGGCSSSRNYRDNGSNRRRSRKRHCSNTAVRNSVAFFLLGLINNSSYVIMMAFAKDIMPAAVGWVYLVNVLPALVVKLSAPYW